MWYYFQVVCQVCVVVVQSNPYLEPSILPTGKAFSKMFFVYRAT